VGCATRRPASVARRPCICTNRTVSSRLLKCAS